MDFIKAIYLGQEPFRTKSTSAGQERPKKSSYESGKTGDNPNNELLTSVSLLLKDPSKELWETFGTCPPKTTPPNPNALPNKREEEEEMPEQKWKLVLSSSNLIYGPYKDNCVCWKFGWKESQRCSWNNSTFTSSNTSFGKGTQESSEEGTIGSFHGWRRSRKMVTPN